jgi:hypothetical protein
MTTTDIRAVSEFEIREFTGNESPDPVKELTLNIMNYLSKHIHECPKSLMELNDQYKIFMSIYSCLYLDGNNLVINYWSKGEYDNKNDVFEFLVRYLAKLQTTDTISAHWVELDDKGDILWMDFNEYDKTGNPVDYKNYLEKVLNLS